MGVPDELRALDDDLAAGRLDAASYRRRRDELRAAAPGPAGPPRGDPFPPPFRWEAPPTSPPITRRRVDDDPEPDVTQVVAAPGPGPSGGSPDLTQVVHPVPTAPPELTQVVRTGTDPTQVVPGAALARTTSSPAPPPAASPPWTAGELARRQGSELFVRAAGPTPAVLVSTMLVVIVAALVVVASLVLS